MLSSLFSRKARFYVSKNEYYETITTENTYLKAVATDLNLPSKKQHLTSKDILYNNKLGLTSKYKEIIEVLGTPVYQVNKSRSNKHHVLFYKKRIGTYNSRLEIHLVNNRFLIGFITFNVANDKEKKTLFDLIARKYEVNCEKDHLGDIKIFNDSNEYIKVIDSVNITLVYGVDSESNNKTITDLANQKELKYLSVDQKNRVDLYNNI